MMRGIGFVLAAWGMTVLGAGAWARADGVPPLASAPFDADEARRHQQAGAAYGEIPLEYENSIGMRLVLIPPGEFLMGSPDPRHAGPGSLQQHLVRITRAFYMGVYEVTQEEYEEVMERNPSWFSREGRGRAAVSDQDTSRFPVEYVTWHDAVEFCRRLSEREKESGWIYRLPTEAEWEYACRAGTTTWSYFGETLDSWRANIRVWREGEVEDDKPHLRRPTHVGSYSANAFGLFDMHGNVSEWVTDWFGADYYAHSPVEDPPGPPADAGLGRVHRGGH